MNKPDFKDQFEKIKRREHKTFGGKTIEILYGAVDANGNPTSAKEGTEDGHGTWSGIEVNGDYRMFVWTHSKAEGGQTEYGTEYKEDALTTMESQILRKRELARSLEVFLDEGKDDEEALAAIQNEWNALPVWNVPTEKEYVARYEKALAEIGPRLQEAKENATKKQEVLVKVNELLDAENFKNARNELASLRDELATIGYAGEDAEKEIRKTVNHVENTLRNKQREFNANMNENRAKAEEAKKEMIVKAKNIVSNVKNFKSANTELDSLFEEWRKVGSAGRDVDGALWAEFNECRKQFFGLRKKFFDDRNDALKSSCAVKEKLIEEAKAIAEKKEYGKAATDRMKELDQEWRKAGYSGKENNDNLWDAFNEAKESFWQAKRDIFVKAVEGDIAKAEKELNNLQKDIEDLEYRQVVAPNPSMKKDVENELYHKNDAFNTKKRQIEDLKKKIA